MIVDVALAVLPTVASVALFAGVGTLIVRGDLVARAIRDGVRPPRTAGRVRPGTARDAAAVSAGEWTAAAETLADVPVPPAVRVQVLYNRVRRFRADRLAAVRARLQHAAKRLADTTRAGRAARVAYKFERSQVIAATTRHATRHERYASVETATATTATTTATTATASEHHVGTVEPDGDHALGRRTSVDGLSVQLKSLCELAGELAARLVGAAARLKDALTSETCRRRTTIAYRLLRLGLSRLESRHFRHVARTAVDVFDGLVAVDVDVYSVTEETSVAVTLFPAAENV